MPRQSNYKGARIYKITNLTERGMFIGTTTSVNLNTILKTHQSRFNHKDKHISHWQRYPKLFELATKQGGFHLFEIKAIKTIPCENARQLKVIERGVINFLNPSLN